MKVLVTGAAGFVGRHVAARLVADGHSVRGLWHLASPRFDLIGVEWVRGDYRDEAEMAHAARGAEAVIHAAFDFGSLNTSLVSAAQANVVGTLALIEAAKSAAVARFVIVSSFAAAGRPVTHYGALKSSIEAFVASYGLGENWPICAVRPPVIYGIDDPIARSTYYGVVARALAGEPDRTGGDDVIHAADLAAAISVILRTGPHEVVGGLFSCGDLAVSDAEVARLARVLVGLESNTTLVRFAPAAHRPSAGPLSVIRFGGYPLFRDTIRWLVKAVQEEVRD